MFSLFICTTDDLGLELGVEFKELDRKVLMDRGIRRIFFNVAVILRYNTEITNTGSKACTLYIIIV